MDRARILMPGDDHQLEELRNDARYSRERYDLYRAKTYGPRPTSATRLRELERAARGAANRLRRAEQKHNGLAGR